jgi:ABC-2 type transport system permease protein
MWRYLKLYYYFVRFSLSRAMEFRMDFFFRIVMDVLFYLVNISFYKIIFLNTSLLGGWNEAQMLVFVAGYLVVDALNMTIFSNNAWWLPIYINKGELDYYLVRPVSSLFFLSLRDFAVNSFMNLLMAIGILVWALWQYPVPLGLGRLLLFGTLLINGTLLYHLFHLLTIIPVFWVHSGRGIEQVFWGFSRSMERPDRIFYGWVRKFLTTIIPFSLMASFPARILLEGIDWRLLSNIIVVTILFFLVIVWLWRMGLRAYSSASS